MKESREMRFLRGSYKINLYLLSATDGLAPKSLRLLAAVRAARADGWFTAADP